VLRCYYCGGEVIPLAHERVQAAIDVLDYDLNSETFTNMFVHMAGCRPENVDAKGRVAVCYFDFVRELVDSAHEVHGKEYYNEFA
jgi:hypothetical protein